jgi:hypothetical protein
MMITKPIFLARKAQSGFVNHRGGLKRLVCVFAGHLVRCQPAQFGVNERQQFPSGLFFGPLDRFKTGPRTGQLTLMW